MRAPRDRLRRRMIRVASYAKVNLFLKVLGRRADGYHELDTVFQSIGLSDSIEISLTGSGESTPRGRQAPVQIELEVVGDGAPRDASNLAWKAASAYFRASPHAGRLSIRLIKRVPSAAGLGGGSSNAAAVLRGLEHLCGPPAGTTLGALARELGSDVPFFLHGGVARASGRGDRIDPLTDLEPASVLVAAPYRAVSTPEVFRGLNLAASPRAALDLERLALPSSGRLRDWLLGNDLEEFVFGGYAEVQEVYNRLQEFGLEGIQLSGSGGAMFAVVDQASKLETIREALRSLARVWITTTVTRADANRIEELQKKEGERGDY